MANLKNIRSQIKSVTSIQKVTKAMKMVAAAKLRKSQENMEKARPYSKKIKELISDLIQDVDRSLLPLLNKKKSRDKMGFVIVTSDRGLAGSFNTNIIKKAEAEINNIGKENTKLICNSALLVLYSIKTFSVRYPIYDISALYCPFGIVIENQP